MFDFKLRLGVDVEKGKLKLKYDNSPTSTNWDHLATFGVIGYQVQPQAHVFIGAGPFSAEDGGSPRTKITGVALKAGAGYEFTPHIAMHVEYLLYTPNEFETSGVKQKFSDIYSKFNSTGYVLNLRFPFEIGTNSRRR